MFGECHAHIFMNGVDYRQAVLDHRDGVRTRLIDRCFEAYQKCSVSYVRDGGDSLGVSQRAVSRAGDYGIRYRTPIFAIHRRGHYGGIVGHGYTTIAEYAQLVRRVRDEGGHFIKIMITGIMDFNKIGRVTGTDLPYSEIKEMIHIAHAEGFAVMVHANGSTAVRNAVLCGADSIEHGNYIDRDCLAALASSKAVWVPTIITVRNLLGQGRFPDEVLAAIWQSQQDNLREAYKKGVLLALGSDAGAYGVSHGNGLLEEYQTFQDILGASGELDAVLKKGESEIRSRF